MDKVLFAAFLAVFCASNTLYAAADLPTAENIIKGHLRATRPAYKLPSFLKDTQPVPDPCAPHFPSNDGVTPDEEESAESLEPVSVKVVGLQNVTGNSCFANAVTQAILSSPPLLNHIGAIGERVSKSPVMELRNVVSQFRKTKPFDILDTKSFVYGSLKRFFGEQEGIQHDAGEFALQLFDLFPKYFPAGVNRTAVTCSACGRESNSRERTTIYDIPYNHSENQINTVEEALANYQKVEELTGAEAYACDICNGKQSAFKQIVISPHEELLVIRLIRESFNKNTSRNDKCFTPIMVGRTVTVNGLEYDLTGAVLHQGNAGFGHYIALIRAPFLHRETSRWTSSPFWYTANDNRIDSPLAGEDMLKAIMAGERPAGFDVVMLFYAKKSGLTETFEIHRPEPPTSWCSIQ